MGEKEKPYTYNNNCFDAYLIIVILNIITFMYPKEFL